MNAAYCFAAIMIGSSLDGVDFAVHHWTSTAQENKLLNLKAELQYAKTVPLPIGHIERISQMRSGLIPIDLDYEQSFTIDLIKAINQNIEKQWLQISDALVFHGPTIRHAPRQYISLQLGDAQLLSNALNLPVMSKLRAADMSAGGQGAPLMPILDAWCFNDYDATLNLGGIANISLKRKDKWLGWDICGCNQLLDFAAGLLGGTYDKNGVWARSGRVRKDVLQQLHQFQYLHKNPPKSLSNEQVERYGIRIFANLKLNPVDLLATYVHHIALEVSTVIRQFSLKKLLITGGGAKNAFLIECLRKACPTVQMDVPEETKIDYKECQLLSLMGVLNTLDEPNAFASVTGAQHDTIGGVWYQPKTDHGQERK